MADTYQAVVNINCWKQIECVGCGGTYRYKFVERVTGTSQKSQAAANKVAEKLATTNIELVLEQRPCPWCGCYQPGMVGQTKDKQHTLLALVLLVVSGVVIGLGFALSATLVTYSTARWLVGVLSVLGLILHAVIATSSPNKDRTANRSIAHQLIVRGQMQAVSKADADLAEGPPRVWSWAAVPLLAVVAGGAAATFTPAVQKLAGGWPTSRAPSRRWSAPARRCGCGFRNRLNHSADSGRAARRRRRSATVGPFSCRRSRVTPRGSTGGPAETARATPPQTCGRT